MERWLWAALSAGLIACLAVVAGWWLSARTNGQGAGPEAAELRPAPVEPAAASASLRLAPALPRVTPPALPVAAPHRRPDPGLWDYGEDCFGIEESAGLRALGLPGGRVERELTRPQVTCLFRDPEGTVRARVELWDDRSLARARRGGIAAFLNREARAARQLGPARAATLGPGRPVQLIGWRRGGPDDGLALTGEADRVLKVRFTGVPRAAAEAFLADQATRAFEQVRR